MTNSLDPREVLMCLNDMGYRNITSTQLKEFIKDLRKLIKYEEQFCSNHNEAHKEQNKDSKVKFDKNSNRRGLHRNNSAPVATAKTISENEIDKTIRKDLKLRRRECENKTSLYIDGTSLNHLEKDKTCKGSLQRGGCEKERLQTKLKQSEEINSARTCRTKSARGIKENDPVELYQYYKREWERFKKNFPGENSHSELRSSIKRKLLVTKGKNMS
ncbi:uncharacterized protein LOC129615923 [Condylostylus longicornis]|uniref:uncharacterized protein LOC129615923 n=1 Tax=Condylostylus longicornis TaxID=2530218 RepID=UPI00244E3E23|nr:uncharacterized protein LOC129615923 [Condylostylus longicornis]